MACLYVLAGNFHHPKVCFSASGLTINEMENESFVAGNRMVDAHIMHAQKGAMGFLLVYWISIDKQHADWTEQKVKQFWSTMLNKKKVGLMTRLDIPVINGNTDNALKMAREFLSEIGNAMPQEQGDYLFGE